MQYRQLAGTDLDVSVLCFGPMRSAAREPGSDAVSRQGEVAFRHALESGINFIHSSFEYSTWWMLGRVLKDYPARNELHHVIKLPVPNSADNGVFDPGKFRERVEDALAALYTDRIDILQWMWRSDPNADELRLPMLANITDDVMATFEKLRDQGKVGYIMPFPYTVPCGKAIIESDRFDGLIAYYNPCETEMYPLFSQLQAQNRSFLAIRPLYAGVLTDERSGALPADDRLAAPENAAMFACRDRLIAAFGDRVGDSITNFAIRFALASAVVGSVIVGLNTIEQVDGLIAAAADAEIDTALVEDVHALWKNE